MKVEDITNALQSVGGLITGLAIEFEIDGDEVICRMPITHAHVGAPGVAHGGAVSAFLDTALGARALVHAASVGRATSTVELKVNFLRPARLGKTLVTSAVVQSAGRSLLVVSGKAVEADTGKGIAFAVGTFNLYKADLRTQFQLGETSEDAD